MSWNQTYNSQRALHENTPDFSGGDPSGSTEVAQQIAEARRLAADLIRSYVVGDYKRDFIVNLSGHANPGHEPRGGYANDCVTISVTQKSEASA